MKTTVNNKTLNYSIGGLNCQVKDSYLITDRLTMKLFCEQLIKEHPEFGKRSVNSYVREWVAHNILYNLNIKRTSTKDTDLNVDESKFRRVCYFILNLLYIERK